MNKVNFQKKQQANWENENDWKLTWKIISLGSDKIANVTNKFLLVFNLPFNSEELQVRIFEIRIKNSEDAQEF